MARKHAREAAVKLIYQSLFADEYHMDALDEIGEELQLSAKDYEYVHKILKGVANNREKIDTIIGQFSKGWNINRIAKVDLAILRLAFYELLFCEDIPSGVSVNEAVELAKKYSMDKSGKFINGILGNYLREYSKARSEK